MFLPFGRTCVEMKCHSLGFVLVAFCCPLTSLMPVTLSPATLTQAVTGSLHPELGRWLSLPLQAVRIPYSKA